VDFSLPSATPWKTISFTQERGFSGNIQVSVELRLPRPESPPPSLFDSFNSE
jgi:hypothetical protein